VTDEKEDEVVESQKLSDRDKKEIQDGACVNCALVSIIFTIIMTIAMAL
jgi:hypothetical protein